jgi:hypothetical protein
MSAIIVNVIMMEMIVSILRLTARLTVNGIC